MFARRSATSKNLLLFCSTLPRVSKNRRHIDHRWSKWSQHGSLDLPLPIQKRLASSLLSGGSLMGPILGHTTPLEATPNHLINSGRILNRVCSICHGVSTIFAGFRLSLFSRHLFDVIPQWNSLKLRTESMWKPLPPPHEYDDSEFEEIKNISPSIKVNLGTPSKAEEPTTP